MSRWKQVLARVLESVWYGRSPLLWLLWPFGLGYELAATFRRRLYRSGLLPSISLPVPVVVVGNITVGGTGKTPLTIWLARRLAERGLDVGVVCRGYGGGAEHWPQEVTAASDPAFVGDEAVLLAYRAGCPVVAGPDRVAAAKRLIERHGVGVVVADDGLQHYRLRRRVEVAAVDGVRGLGNGHCLPAGPLREPKSRLRDVDAIVVNGGDWGHAGVSRCRMQPLAAYEIASGAERLLGDFKGRAVHAVAAIGHPRKFFDMLEAQGLVVEGHALADHANIALEDLSFDDDDPVFVTEKDAVKCRGIDKHDVWCVVAELEFEGRDGERLMRLIMRGIEGEAA